MTNYFRGFEVTISQIKAIEKLEESGFGRHYQASCLGGEIILDDGKENVTINRRGKIVDRF